MPDNTCFVCGGDPHPDNAAHNYWSTADAMREAREHDRKVILTKTKEARYVEQHRPY